MKKLLLFFFLGIALRAGAAEINKNWYLEGQYDLSMGTYGDFLFSSSRGPSLEFGMLFNDTWSLGADLELYWKNYPERTYKNYYNQTETSSSSRYIPRVYLTGGWGYRIFSKLKLAMGLGLGAIFYEEFATFKTVGQREGWSLDQDRGIAGLADIKAVYSVTPNFEILGVFSHESFSYFGYSAIGNENSIRLGLGWIFGPRTDP